MVTWSRKPSAAIHQLRTFSIPIYGPPNFLFLQLHPLRECDLIPSCRFQPSFDVLAFCSHVPSPSWIWFLTSIVTDSGTTCDSPCLLPCHSLYTSFRPTNQCRIIFSTPILLLSVPVCPRFVGLSSQHGLDWLQPHSFCQLLTVVRCSPFLPLDQPILLVSPTP